jgi:hypothetical protein
LKRIEKPQALEFNELFPPTDDSETDELEDEPEDLNMAIASALVSRALPKSPVDYPSLRGYGDFVESTQLEKIGLDNRNLLDIRGLEAVQESSHRGPAGFHQPRQIAPVHYGVFTGKGISFTPTQLIDSSKMTLNALIAEFNRAVPGFGDDPRFFVGTTEIDPTALIPGQPYSVYPKKIARPTESRAQLGGPIQPPRLEGPLINIQWKVSDINGAQLCPPGNCTVPEEISLLQLFKTFVLSRYRIQGIQILWGNHYRAGSIFEISKVTSLEQGDLVEIIVDQGIAPQATQIEVKYVVGSEEFTTYVNRSTTIEQLTQRLAYAHKGKGIHAIASEGFTIAPEDSVEDWLQRTADIPLTAVLPKTVQVIIEFRGVEKHLAVQDTASETDFKALVRHFVGLGQKVPITVIPLGLDKWEVRPGFKYWVAENRQMEINLTDTSAVRFKLKIAQAALITCTYTSRSNLDGHLYVRITQ